MSSNVDCPKKWKSAIAQEAYSEMVKAAGLEKDRLLEDIMNGDHSEYERGLLRANVSRVYLDMIGSAYTTATTVEAQFLGLSAGVSRLYMREDG